MPNPRLYDNVDLDSYREKVTSQAILIENLTAAVERVRALCDDTDGPPWVVLTEGRSPDPTWCNVCGEPRAQHVGGGV